MPRPEKWELKLVAQNDEFTLWLYPTVHQNGWMSYKLSRRVRLTKRAHHPTRRRVNHWWLVWNGDRFARTRYSLHLETYFPLVYKWVVDNIPHLSFPTEFGGGNPVWNSCLPAPSRTPVRNLE